ncbi:MAG: hypothetical protein BJ554DRAFT_6070, partial [Olpidium bornovanus]
SGERAGKGAAGEGPGGGREEAEERRGTAVGRALHPLVQKFE